MKNDKFNFKLYQKLAKVDDAEKNYREYYCMFYYLKILRRRDKKKFDKIKHNYIKFKDCLPI